MHGDHAHKAQGKKVLSFLFGLGDEIVSMLHQTIKNVMPLSDKAALADYGEVSLPPCRLSVSVNAGLLPRLAWREWSDPREDRGC